MTLLHNHPVDLKGMELDPAIFDAINRDLETNAAARRPLEGWRTAGGSAEGHQEGDFSAENMLSPWIGFGENKVTPQSLFFYYQYLKDIDSLGLVDQYFSNASTIKPKGSDLIVADLGTILDLNLMMPFVDRSENETLYVLEVGGGYGRLAEAMFNVVPGKIKYVLVDAVPSSLFYSYFYLSRSNPDLKIGYYYNGDDYDLDRFDIYICPIWHFRDIEKVKFNLGVNIQSMQEMSQENVDFYYDWFNSILADNGIAYLVNRRTDHVFKGDYNHPGNWESLLKIMTPRSWKRDFPAEVFRKGSRDHMSEYMLRDALYRRSLTSADVAVTEEAMKSGYSLY